MPQLELERRFCQMLGASAAGLGDEQPLRSLLSDKHFNVAAGMELARNHGLDPAAHRLFNNPAFKDRISSGAYRQLLRDQANDMIRRGLFERSLNTLLDRFNSRRLPTIPLKGILYAHRLYDPFWLRSFSDVDLLVREDDWPQVLGVLKDLNYESLGSYDVRPPQLTKNDIPQHITWRSPSGCVFDIALDLFKLGFRSSLFDLAWSSAMPYTLRNRAVNILSNEFEILNICAHLHRHGFNRLIWFVDLALAIQKLAPDWDKVAGLARTGGLDASVYFALNYLNRFFGPLVDPSIVNKFQPGRVGCFFFAKHWPEAEMLEFKAMKDGPIVFRGKLFGANLIANLALTGQSRGKAAYFARKLWPSHEFLKRKFNRESNERTYLGLYFKRCAAYIRHLPRKTPTTSSDN